MTWCLGTRPESQKRNPWSKSSSTQCVKQVHHTEEAVEYCTAVQGAILTIEEASQVQDVLLLDLTPLPMVRRLLVA